ncbi:lipoprotein 17-related variable surface protein [Mycoplasma sp. E35C]|uniref:lipoprotein 17-related variable surface protein n=1 Tax=Mycoplasma sp. E35C TaxID=2801918 RepID=UPI001CA424F5|nr:lipoprotein 17-related variable surface protein [Mycoplasma sp. E35C]QZX49267.1 hypothetical protein JJE79_00670 [Mycoplasma sp. E35C]
MKVRKLIRFASFFALSTILTSALASCSTVTSSGGGHHNPGGKSLLQELEEKVQGLNENSVRLTEDKQNKTHAASEITPENISISMDHKFDDFKPVIKVVKQDDAKGELTIKVQYVFKTDASVKTTEKEIVIHGLQVKLTTKQRLENVLLLNQGEERTLDLGDANWKTFEEISTAAGATKVFHEHYKNIPELQKYQIKGVFELVKAPEEDSNKDVVLTFKAVKNSKITLVPTTFTNDGVEFQIDSLKIANVRPTQISLKAWNGTKESINAFEDYRKANWSTVDEKQTEDSNRLVQDDIKKNLGSTVGSSKNPGRVAVNPQYYRYNENNLKLYIDKKQWWVADPITVERSGNNISDYSILVTTKFGEGDKAKEFVTNAYKYEIFSKRIDKTDLTPTDDNKAEKVNGKSRLRIDRNNIIPEVFSYTSEARNNIGLFLGDTLDRTKLTSFVTYGDEKMNGTFDYSLNVQGQHGNKIVQNADSSGDWKMKLESDMPTNYIFVIGFSNKKEGSKVVFNPNLTFLNIPKAQPK